MQNKLLQRQIQKYLGSAGQLPEQFITFLKSVNESYEHFEKDRKMLERSIEISSQEMVELNDKLRKDTEELKKVHKELSTLFEKIDEVFFTFEVVVKDHTLALVPLQVSPACKNLYGYSDKQFFKEPDLWRRLIFDEDKIILDRYFPSLQAGKSVSFEHRICHRNGAVNWVETKVTPTLDKFRNLIRLDGVVTDINDRKNAELERRESEKRFRLISENPFLGITWCSPEGILVSVNETFCKMLGYSKDELIGRHFSAFTHPDDIKVGMDLIEGKLSSVDSYQVEKRYLTKNGEVIWANLNLSSVTNENGEVDYRTAIIQDITARKKSEELLNHSEERYRQIVETAQEGIWMLDKDNRTIFVNKKMADILECSISDMTGKQLFDFMDNEGKSIAMENIRKRRQHGAENQEFKFVTAKKKSIWANLSTTPILDKTGGFNGALAMVSDVTKRKLAEESLQKSKANLKNILENTDTAYVLLDKNANILSYNRLAKELAAEEMKEELMKGKNYIDLMVESRREEVRASVNSVLAEKKQISYEVKYLKPGAAEKWLLISMHPIFNSDGKGTMGLSIAATDITARKTNEQQIRLSNERYELVTRVTNDVIWDWDIANDKIYRSENYKEIFGYEGGEDNVYVSSWITHIHPEDRERIIGSARKKIHDSDSLYWEDEYRYYRSNGELAYVQDRGYIIQDDNRKAVRIVGSMRDITKDKLNAIEKDQITSDLIQRNKDLEQFAYIVSHNLRAPVANILGLSNIIKNSESLSKEEYNKCMDGLNLSVTKLDNVILDLNYILQIRREINEKKEVTIFSDLVNDVKTSIDNLIKKENAIIKTDFTDIEGMFTLKSYLNSIFYNLILNSIKYRSPEKFPVIEISSHKVNNKVQLRFKDNGLGIDTSLHQNKLFGLYKKFHFHKEGKGMGLYIVKTQVEMLGGKITLKSEVNEGAEFLIEMVA